MDGLPGNFSKMGLRNTRPREEVYYYSQTGSKAGLQQPLKLHHYNHMERSLKP